jgi:hypothetical protein
MLILSNFCYRKRKDKRMEALRERNGSTHPDT